MTLGDRVAVMRHGYLQHVDRPQVLYDRPSNLFVASFIGSPAMNFVGAELEDGTVRFGPHVLRIDESALVVRPALREYVGRKVALGIRPEDLEDAALEPGVPDDRRLSVAVDIKEDMGSEVFLHFAVDAPPVKTEELREVVGAEALEAAEEQTHHHGNAWVARVERSTRAREGEQIELAVDTRRLHFFDLDSGQGIYDGAAATRSPLAAEAASA
jgi:multiple sugar transport system ATP-binding protein